MRYRLAISSGLIFAITWPHFQNPAARRAFLCDRQLLRSRARYIILDYSSQHGQALTCLPRSRSNINAAIITMSTSTPLTYSILAQQSAETSNALMGALENNTDFDKLASYEGNLTVQRDTEDAQKLQVGIDYAKQKGVIDPNYVPSPYIEIDVLGKTPSQVADEIIQTVQPKDSSDHKSGSVIVLCGLSGTGKGTTVTKLKLKLEGAPYNKQVVTWSNGNIFRSVTLLAATWCEQQPDCHGEFNADKALTKENVASFMSMLSFDKFDERYDTRIHGLGLDLMVSQVQNTELKSPKVSKNIPTVAQVTQGEVILFAADAVERMGHDGLVVLLEGREQTVNYVRTPYRFTLVLSDESLIGKRRAAQRLMAETLKNVPQAASNEQITDALQHTLANMVADIQ